MIALENIESIHNTASTAAQKAAQDYITKHGEDWYCGFAWVNIYGVKGNTKLGKRFKQAGLTKDYTQAYSIWNPGKYGGQSMDVKEAGASAYAAVLNAYGFRASAGSRAD